MNELPKISVIIPFYNEEENIDSVLKEVLDVLQGQEKTFEVICVDDASTDGTNRLLKAASEQIPQLRLITHSKRRGQGTAFWTGFEAARGGVMVTMDGDGQNDFRDVPRMLALLEQGNDGVFGQRVRRKDPIQKLVATRIGFFFRRIVLGDQVRDTACALKVMKKEALRCLIPIRGFLRFIPFLFEQAGLPYETIEVNHRPRLRGVTKYSLLKGYFWSTIIDLLFMWWYKKNNVLRRKDGEKQHENISGRNQR